MTIPYLSRIYELFTLSIRVCRDAVTRRSLGYAYVNYLNTADGEPTLQDFDFLHSERLQVNALWSNSTILLSKALHGQ
jgi:polyadenylate-binding protein